MPRQEAARFVLSPCGTSLLTNGSSEEERRLLNRHSNKKSLDGMGSGRSAVEARVQRVREATLALSLNDVRRAAAELNGILTFEAEEPKECRYHHLLLCTDTWLGEQTGRIVEEWLRKNRHGTIELRRQSDLQTANLPMFRSALSDLVQWLDSTITGYRQQQYRAVFNLTGGFKSV